MDQEIVDTLPTVREHPFDPPSEFVCLREQKPLSRLAYPDGQIGWLVTSHELARAVLADHRYSAATALTRCPVPLPQVEGLTCGETRPGFFFLMNPPHHTRFRRQLTGHFTVRRMSALQASIEKIVEGCLSSMAQAGPPSDLLADFAQPVASLTICELLGVPAEDRAGFERDSALMDSLTASEEGVRAAARSFDEYLADLIERKRAEPADDLLSALIGNAGDLTDSELLGVGHVLLRAGHVTTAQMLALGTFALLCHPEQLEALLAGRCSIENTVEELVRYLTINQHGITRTALEDIELGGQLIKQGESVTVALPAANRDPLQFENPDELDLAREAHGHMGFGHGPHACLGMHLARIELRVGYTALFARFPTLRLAVPPEDVRLRHDMTFYGVHNLPVTWGELTS